MIPAAAMPIAIAAIFGGADLTPLANVSVREGDCALPRRIVTDASARSKSYALYAASIIARATGERPEVFTGVLDSRWETPSIFVRCEFLADDAFSVVVTNGNVMLSGRTDYAVCDFLERFLGVRHYAPGVTYIPTNRSIRLPAIEYTDAPVFKYRASRQADGVFQAASRFGATCREEATCHVPRQWNQDPEIVRDHFEIFARTPDGKRATNPLLCYGNPQTLDYVMERIRAAVREGRDSGGMVNAERKTVSVSPWDIPVCCDCEWCRGRIGEDPDGGASQLVWGDFAKRLSMRLKAEFPEYRLQLLAYWNACSPPKGVNYLKEGNVDVMYAMMSGMAGPDRDRGLAEAREWTRLAGTKVLFWDYACWPAEFTSAPYVFGRTAVREYRRHSDMMHGAFVCGGGDGARLALSMYVWYRSLWNPGIDVDAVYDAFAVNLFGAAAGSVRKLIDLQERGWEKMPKREPYCDRTIHGIVYPRSTVDEMRRLLAAAESAVAGDGRAAKNLCWYRSGFERFFAESDAVARGERKRRKLEFGKEYRMIPAIDWQGTETTAVTVVKTEMADGEVKFCLKCTEPDMKGICLYASQYDETTNDLVKVCFAKERGLETAVFVVNSLGGIVFRKCGMLANPARSGFKVSGKGERGKSGWSVELTVGGSVFDYPLVNAIRWRAGDATRRRWLRLGSFGDTRDLDRSAFFQWR